MSNEKALEALTDALVNLINHREIMPDKNFTPAEYRAWDNEKSHLMHIVWTATVGKRSLEAIKEALQPKAVDVDDLCEVLYKDLGLDKHIEKVVVRTAVENHLQAQGYIQPAWQPIETAPKDGTEILICGGLYRDEIIMIYGEQKLFGCAVVSWDCENWEGGGHSYKPTHWQPLLAVPEASK